MLNQFITTIRQAIAGTKTETDGMADGLIESPTGKGIRSDSQGDGRYFASRGTRRHRGLDFICNPGQVVTCPIDNAKAVRTAYPYADTREYSGVLLRNSQFEILIFYMDVRQSIFGKTLAQGDIIGTAQDITRRYSNKMTPHIHLQIKSVDPELLMGKTK